MTSDGGSKGIKCDLRMLFAAQQVVDKYWNWVEVLHAAVCLLAVFCSTSELTADDRQRGWILKPLPVADVSTLKQLARAC